MANTNTKQIKKEKVEDTTVEEVENQGIEEKLDYPTHKYNLGEEIEYKTFKYNPYRGTLEEKTERGVIDQRMLIQNIQKPIWRPFYLVENEGSLISEDSIVNVIHQN